MAKYRKKPVIIEAFRYEIDEPPPQWFQQAEGTIIDCITGYGSPDGYPQRWCRIVTPEGKMIAQQGDWIIRGIQGELYPCKNEIFEATYEAVEED